MSRSRLFELYFDLASVTWWKHQLENQGFGMNTPGTMRRLNKSTQLGVFLKKRLIFASL